jgi:hypothetical protein
MVVTALESGEAARRAGMAVLVAFFVTGLVLLAGTNSQ